MPVIPLIRSSHSQLPCVWINRWVSSVWNLKFAVVVVLILLALPLCLDSGKGGATIAAGVAVWNWLWCPPSFRVEDTRVGAVEVTVCEVGGRGPFAESVAGALAHVREDVSADVPAPQCV
jgi:hypothetical protein